MKELKVGDMVRLVRTKSRMFPNNDFAHLYAKSLGKEATIAQVRVWDALLIWDKRQQSAQLQRQMPGRV